MERLLSASFAVGTPTGFIGWIFPIIGQPLWTLIVPVLLWHGAERSVAMGEPAPGTAG